MGELDQRQVSGVGIIRENLLSAHEAYRPQVHWRCVGRREWTTYGHAPLRALSFNDSKSLSRITLALSFFRRCSAKDLGRQRAEKVPIVAGPELGSTPDAHDEPRGTTPTARSQVARARKRGPQGGPHSAAGTRQPAPPRANRDRAVGRLRGKGHVLRTSLQRQKLFFSVHAWHEMVLGWHNWDKDFLFLYGCRHRMSLHMFTHLYFRKAIRQTPN